MSENTQTQNPNMQQNAQWTPAAPVAVAIPPPPVPVAPYPPQPRKLFRSTANKWLGGVCGGLAEHFGTDATLVRVLWVIMTIASAGVGILAYLAFWLIVDKDPGYHGTYTQTVAVGDGRLVHNHYHY